MLTVAPTPFNVTVAFCLDCLLRQPSSPFMSAGCGEQGDKYDCISFLPVSGLSPLTLRTLLPPVLTLALHREHGYHCSFLVSNPLLTSLHNPLHYS